MRLLTRTIFFIVILLSVGGCKKTLTSETLPAHIAVGSTYYTQFVIRYEKNTHLTTNYRRGGSIPVNTPVKLLAITNKAIKIELTSSTQAILIKNVKKHTGQDTVATFDRYFSPNTINLSQFSRLERKHIKEGSVAKGMSKKAVTTAIGYPPITETFGLEADKWVYWSHRFNKFNVNFKGNRVSSVVD